MAISVLQAEKILQAAHQGQVRLMVAFMKRFDPGMSWPGRRFDNGSATALKVVFICRNHGFQGHWLNRLTLYQYR